MANKTNRKKKQTHWEIFWEPLTKLNDRLSRNVNKKKNEKNLQNKIAFVLALAALLPLLGWVIGAYLNPDGWMSSNPFIAYYYLIALPVGYWEISLIVIGVFIALLYLFKAAGPLALKLLTALVFIWSLVCSIVIMTFVRDAGSSEFTG